MNTIAQRLDALRSYMHRNDYEAFIVPTNDPHGSEYPATCWACREWLTGFTGSAGTAVITTDTAYLWTDSRYWLQAAAQLEGTGIRLMREGEDADWPDVLKQTCRGKVGAYAATFTAAERDALRSRGIHMVCAADPFDEIWEGRPAQPCEPAELFPEAVAGLAAKDKLQAICREAQLDARDRLFLSDLSEIAWTLNLRGADIAYNPVFLAYLTVGPDATAILYTNPARVGTEVAEYLAAQGVEVRPYDAWKEEVRKSAGTNWKLTDGTNCAVTDAAKQVFSEYLSNNRPDWNDADVAKSPVMSAQKPTLISSPVQMLRAIKTPEEQAGFRRAMERDGVAMVRFLRKLDEIAQNSASTITETGIDELLTGLRAEQEGFRGLSFATIAAYGAHGAIVHYEAEPDTDCVVKHRGLLLLDSGAQYDCGTTDITRTIAMGPVTDEERRVYTLVLKGHIGLSSLRFPDGTCGLELDLAARRDMWQAGYDFGHGTGHGVGSRLCVHEGPQQIRKNLRGCTMVPFRAGMTVTDEPGIYVEGRFGVRIENTLLTVDDGTTSFGRFLRFEPLTLCPIDLRPVDFAMLTPDERRWLDSYHAEVRRRLMPLLSDETDRKWLAAATDPIGDR